ncbi:MAG: hypothetical protein LBD63_00905 [Mycoplasmataceae bacterium]|jgi:hypothetical protein|nr:hypothetical protein [Mycoplasmataceae bacterium]
MSENKNGKTSQETSSNWKLAIILCTILLSFIVGLIIYLVKAKVLTDSDRKISRLIVIIFGAFEIGLIIILVIVISVLASSAVHASTLITNILQTTF